ncbi:right-handed parallel beta-helix repeat-containing protein [Methanobacterium petrolearium]|uniref:right-handed parallel beta-helix repeat-containing protein n=1 Tax=Methanobacterium petrolearium TaxID=710190 RepID=UPI003081A149|nr:hypothetical protein GCM10025861_04580 [Methanobacterium petrolearium]
MVEYRKQTGNDQAIYWYNQPQYGLRSGIPISGLYIWHLDATLDEYGKFYYDNSYTVHNLVDLLQADGLFDIQNGSHEADAGDAYQPSTYLGINTTPNSNWYNGTFGFYVYNIANPENQSSATIGWQGPLFIGVALENEDLIWDTSGTGNVVWFGTQNMGQNDADSAQSGFIWDNELTWVTTQFDGPGYLQFAWKVSSELSHDFLSFYIDGVLQSSISGEQDWANMTFILGSGNHVLNWTYSKDSSTSSGFDCGWLDFVRFSNQYNIYVAADGDDDTGDGSLINPYKTLAKAIDQAPDSGTVHLGNGIYYEVNNRELNIIKNINILFDDWKGSGAAVIDAENLTWIFNVVDGVNLTLKDLTLINSNAANRGAIYNAGNLTIINCTFAGNTATGANGYGGAIYNSGNCTITYGSIINNIAFYGGGIYNTGNCTISGSSILNNTAYIGSVIYTDNNNTQINFNSILNNTGNYDIYSSLAGADAINNWWGTNFQGTNPQTVGRVNGNVVADPWIVLSLNNDLVGSGETSIVNVNLNYNSAGEDTLAVYGKAVPDVNVLFTSNFGNFSSVTGTISNGLNATTTFTAGSILAIGAVNARVDSQTVSGVKIIDRNNVYVATDGNDSTGNGSKDYPFENLVKALSEVQTTGTVNVGKGTYSGANNRGLTIVKDMIIRFDDWKGSESAIIDAENVTWIFKVNTGVNVTLQNLTLINGNATNGGAIYNAGNLTTVNCTFMSNNASKGGAIYNSGNCTVIGGSIANNTVVNDGGAIYNSGYCVINDCSILDNTATAWNGGAIYNSGYFAVNDCSILSNTATAGNGGGIYNNRGNCTVTDSIVQNNTAYYYGGGIYNRANCNINGSYVLNNIATYGSGIYNYQSNCTVIGVCIQNNTATVYGGGIYNSGGIITVIDTSVLNNKANYGGALYNSGNCTVIGGFIQNNTVTGTYAYGGAFYNSGNCTVIGGFIQNNTVTGTYAYGGAFYNSGNCTVIGGFISNNTVNAVTSSNGGGIYNSDGNFTVTNCSIVSNTAYNGGGIFNYANCAVVNCTFSSNKASNYGGAIYASSSSNLNVTSSTLTNNQATWGSAIFTYASNTQINFNRILNNTGNRDVYGTAAGVNATNNWWGTNFQGTDPQTAGKVNSKVNATTWLVLTASTNATNVPVGGNLAVNVDLTHDNMGIDTSSQGHLPDGIPVYFTSSLGIVNPTNSTTINGMTSTIFTGTTFGLSTLNVTVDYQNVNLQFDIGIIDLFVRNYEWYPNRNDTYSFGEAPPYVSYVKNYGPDVATGIVVKYSIGSGLIYKGYSVPLGGISRVVFDGQNLTYYVDYLPANSLAAIIIYLQVNSTGIQTSELTTNASLVSVNQTESGSWINYETRKLKVAPAADIQVKQDTITYNGSDNTAIIRINVINNGPDTATNIDINNTLPVGMVYTGHSAGESYNSDVWHIDSLTSGTIKTLEIYVNVTATNGTLFNTATKINSTPYDWCSANNEQTMNLTFTNSYQSIVDLLVRNYEWYPNRNDTYSFGEAPPYVSYVKNYGPDVATGIVVKYSIGSGLIYKGYSVPLGGISRVVFDGQNLTYYVDYLPANSLAAIIIYLQVNSTGIQTSELTTNASLVSVNQTESGSWINYETRKLKVAPAADIQVKQDVNGQINVETNSSQDIVITVTVTNKGPDNCDNIIIDDLLIGLTYVGNDKEAVYDNESGKITWNIGSLSSGESAVLHITVKADHVGIYTLSASKNGSSAPYDWDQYNDVQNIFITRIQ